LGFTQGLVLLPFFVSLVFLRASIDLSAQKNGALSPCIRRNCRCFAKGCYRRLVGVIDYRTWRTRVVVGWRCRKQHRVDVPDFSFHEFHCPRRKPEPKDPRCRHRRYSYREQL